MLLTFFYDQSINNAPVVLHDCAEHQVLSRDLCHLLIRLSTWRMDSRICMC